MVEYSRGARRMTITSDTLVTVDEAAEVLGIPPATIRVWIHRKQVNSYGHQDLPLARPRIVVDLREVQQFMEVRSKIMP